MTDHLVVLPPGLDTTAQQKRATLPLLALIAAYGAPEKYGENVAEVEQLLLNRFAPASSLSFNDIEIWLASARIVATNLSDLVGEAAQGGNGEPLHATLQSQNDAGMLHLVAIANSGALASVDMPEKPLGEQGQPCLLVRVGYNDEQPYGSYFVGLPGQTGAPTQIGWESVIAAGISAVLAIAKPVPPVDHDMATNALHILEQTLETAQQAHTSIAAALGVGSASA